MENNLIKQSNPQFRNLLDVDLLDSETSSE
jgi:hypothetical protein